MDAEDLMDGMDADVVIVGAGMAGITLAERLRGDGRSVCLLESGGVDPETATQRLAVGESVGHPYFRLDRSRFRVFGGSSIRWGGWCRPLDPIDFETRGWIAGSGWPLDHLELARHYTDAASILALETDSFEMADWRGRIPHPPSLDDAGLTTAVIQHGAQVDFGERWRAVLADDPSVTVLLHANVTELVLDASGEHLDHVRIATLGGRRLRVRGRVIVLAAGAIENARLLLASRERRSTGIGNEGDLVGRCFMEHLHVAPAFVVPNPGCPIPSFFAHELGIHRPAHGVLTPTERALAEHGFGSCSISLAPPATAMRVIPRLNWPTALMTASESAARRLRRERPRVDASVRRAALATWKAARTWTVRRSLQGTGQVVEPEASIAFLRAEQLPNLGSRVMLSPGRDRLGIPKVRLDWRLTPGDLEAVRCWVRRLDEVCSSSGIGRVVPRAGWEREIAGGPHHMGTTRMSASPVDGVVDADCRVHGVDNLYVAGSSVFTTGGHANPSYTVLALTLRLADHLGASSRPSVAPVVPASVSSGSAPNILPERLVSLAQIASDG